MSEQDSADYHILRTGLIWLFSGAIIFLGAKELYMRHARHQPLIKMEPQQMILELRGDLDLARLVKDPEALKAVVDQRNQVQSVRLKNIRLEIEKLVP